MNVLILVFFLLSVAYAREVSVTLDKLNTEGAVVHQQQYCADSTGSVQKDGSKCKVLMDEDNQKTSDFDFISASSVKQPTQLDFQNSNIGDAICTNNLNNERCLVYRVDVTDFNLYSGCVVSVAGLGASRTENGNGTVAYSGSKVTLNGEFSTGTLDHTVVSLGESQTHRCTFAPVNNKYIGNVEYHVKFIKKNPHRSEVDFVQVRIDAVFTPSVESLYPVEGFESSSNHHDKVVTEQHDALVLMGRTKVLNKLNDQCEADDGIDKPRFHKTGADLVDSGASSSCASQDTTTTQNAAGQVKTIDCSLQQRSTGDGECFTTGVESYLVSMSKRGDDIVYPKINSLGFTNIKTAYGVGIQMRVKAHFVDRRYKVIDQTGVETLEDNIGNFSVRTQGLEIGSKYHRYGGTRKDVNTSFNLKKKNYDDYPSNADVQKCRQQAPATATGDINMNANDNQLLQSGDCTNVHGEDYAVYYMDHDHVLVYEHIKHVQPNYLRSATCGDGSGCSHALLVKGFKDANHHQVQIKIPVDVTPDTDNEVKGNLPKSHWNIYVPKIKVTAKDVARITDDQGNKEVRPLYGLPVQDSEHSPQFPDGIPLSHLFKIELEEEIEANTYEVDSYNDGYELFTKLTTRTRSGVNMIDEYYGDITGSQIDCSSNRVQDVQNAFGDGKVYNLGRATTIIEQAQKYFDNCRIKINSIGSGTLEFMDQALISWNKIHDPRCCQEDEKVEKIGSGALVMEGGANVVCDQEKTTLCGSRLHNNIDKALSEEALVKLTLIDRRKVMIGTTELSLLRRQEIFENHGVTVSGSNIQISLSKENGDESANGVLGFDIYGTQSLAGYDETASLCTSVSGVCEEIHGCALDSNGNFVDGSDTVKCAEKLVETPQKDNEYTLHTIRSSSQCNGRLDIQLRQRQPLISMKNLLMDGSQDSGLGFDTPNPNPTGILRPVYDVRLPCSRVTARTSDTLTIKFDFNAEYDLKLNEYTLTVGGNNDMEADTSDGVWTKTYDADNTAVSGFTKIITATPYIGECPQHFKQTAITIGPTSGCDVLFQRDACDDFCDSSKVEDAADCLTLEVQNDQLVKTFKLAMVYERTFKYNVPRDHNLDDEIGPTTTEETTWFCQDQKFSVSVDRNKQASVRVTTPLQIIVERKAQIQEIEWVASKDTNDCDGENVFQLRVKVHVQEQNVQGANTYDDFEEIPEDGFSVQTVSSTDGLTVKTAHSGTKSFVELKSACIEIAQSDCSLVNDSPFKALTETSTEFLVTGKDTNLGTSATQVDITSNVVVNTNFVACPLDQVIEETGELEAALSFEVANCLTDPLQQPSTAKDQNNADIKNCPAALITQQGYANLHTYVKESNGVLQYEHGNRQTNALNFQIDNALWKLVRYEPGFGTDELGPQVGSKVDLCSTDSSGTVTKVGTPVVPGSDQELSMELDSTFGCGFGFKEFGTANALNDVFEVEVDVNMKSASATRRLRKTIRLKAGDLHSEVGFRVISDTTTVSDAEAESSLPTNSAKPEKHVGDEGDDARHTMLVVLIIVVSLVVAVVVLIMIRNRCSTPNSMPMTQAGVASAIYKKVDTEERFDNLRY